MSSRPSPVTRFVILAAPRTGSNMLCTLLNSHPDILCHHELFNPDGIYYALDLRESSFTLGTLEERDRDPVAFLDRAWASDQGHACVGFKMTHRQNELVFRTVLEDPAVRKIVLKRKNRLRTFVSRLIAEQTGVWEAYHPSDLPSAPPQVVVRLPDLHQSIAANEQYYQELEEAMQASRQSFLTLTYEELSGNEQRREMLRFLGAIGDQPGDLSCLRVESVRQNSRDLRQMIANFAELRDLLRGTDLESELDTVEGRLYESAAASG